MLAKRIIPCLDVKDGKTVKGTKFVDFKEAGDPVLLGEIYSKEGADELVYLDITASSEGRSTFTDLVKRVASRIDIPFTVGGGVNSLQDIDRLLNEIPDEMAKMVLACINEMLISFYDLMARTELNRKKKRQKEGIEEMKKRGEWEKYGRPRIMKKEDFAEEYQKVENKEIGSLELMRKLGLSKDTYFRYVREYKIQKKIH